MNAWMRVSAAETVSEGRRRAMFLRWKKAVLVMWVMWRSNLGLVSKMIPRLRVWDAVWTQTHLQSQMFDQFSCSDSCSKCFPPIRHLVFPSVSSAPAQHSAALPPGPGFFHYTWKNKQISAQMITAFVTISYEYNVFSLVVWHILFCFHFLVQYLSITA